MSRGTSKRHSTEYVSIDTKLCKACWECVEACPEEVIGKVNILFHKHAKIAKGERCQGCLICAEVCEHQAISPIHL